MVEAVRSLGGDGRDGLPRRDVAGRCGRGGRRRRVRPRRLPATRCDRPVLAGDGAVIAFAVDGGPVVGICNGFQVLTEAHLLPGALQKNAGLKFLCGTVEIRVETDRLVADADQPKSGRCSGSRSITSRATTPAHPRRWPNSAIEDRIVLRYVDNPNGSVDDIAGICNDGRNVVGLMPHPERAMQRAPGIERRRRDGAVDPGGRRCQSGRGAQRLMPACLSTLAGTPTSRQAA